MKKIVPLLLLVSGCSRLANVCGDFPTRDCVAVHVLSSLGSLDQIEIDSKLLPLGTARSPKTPSSSVLKLPASIPLLLSAGVRQSSQDLTFSVTVIGYRNGMAVAQSSANGLMPSGSGSGRAEVVVRLDDHISGTPDDLSQVTPDDLSTSSQNDLTTTGGALNCQGIITCGGSCTTQQCIMACSAMGKPGSANKYSAALGCEQMFCVTNNACKVDASNNLVNLDGTTPTAGTPCSDCLNDSTAGLFGASCMGTTYCNPASCSSAVSACLSDP